MSSEAGVREAAIEGLIRYAARIHSRGWCSATAGNFSVTLSREPLELIVTRSGFDKGRIERGDLLVVGADGRPVHGESARPSDETPLHLTIVRETGAGAVLHTHSVWGTLLGERFLPQRSFTLTGYEMLKAIRGIDSHRETLDVPVLENSQDLQLLSTQLTRLLRQRPGLFGFLIAGHGLYAWGRDLEEAGRHLEGFEFLFELAGRRIPLAAFEG